MTAGIQNMCDGFCWPHGADKCCSAVQLCQLEPQQSHGLALPKRLTDAQATEYICVSTSTSEYKGIRVSILI